MKSKHVGKNRNFESEFAAMLEQNLEGQNKLQPGQYIQATIKDISGHGDFILVKTPDGTGIITKNELLDDEGKVLVNPGERIHAFFVAMESGEHHYTTVPGGKARKQIVESCIEHQVPLEGKILRKVKGGYEIQIGEVQAFCPGSQMDGDPDTGAKLTFIITEASDRRTIASNRVYKEILREVEKDRLREHLEEGDIVEGTVKSLHDFGAFIELGGMEGLVPISEISFQRINHPSDVLKTGQKVRLKVMSIDWKEDRISLSHRAMLQNPWQGSLPFSEGDIMEGTVENIKNFGVFVTLTEQFTGLIPNSESGVPRGQQLDKTFSTGEKVQVMIVRIDRESQRVTLSVSKVKEAATRKDYEDYISNSKKESAGDGISSFGKALLESLEKDKKGK